MLIIFINFINHRSMDSHQNDSEHGHVIQCILLTSVKIKSKISKF